MIESYIDSGLLVLVPVLYIIGMVMKKMQRFNSAYLPIILGILGIILSAMYFFTQLQIDDIKDVVEYLFNSIVQGILAAGASVYFNQVKRQMQTNEIKSLFYKK
jgi:hypothetical protein